MIGAGNVTLSLFSKTTALEATPPAQKRITASLNNECILYRDHLAEETTWRRHRATRLKKWEVEMDELIGTMGQIATLAQRQIKRSPVTVSQLGIHRLADISRLDRPFGSK